MNERKNAAHGAGTPGRQVETVTFGRASVCQTDFITSQFQKQGLIEPLLCKGEDNAIPSSVLVDLIGVKSNRELQAIIAQERENGALILSTCRGGGGYFLPADGEAGKREIAAFVATLRARALNTLRVLRAAHEALEGIDGQMGLDDLEGV